MVLPRVYSSLTGIPTHRPHPKLVSYLSKSLPAYYSGHLSSHRLSGHLSGHLLGQRDLANRHLKHRSRNFSSHFPRNLAKSLSGYRRLVVLSQTEANSKTKTKTKSRRNGKKMEDNSAVEKSRQSQEDLKGQVNSNPKRKRERTKPGAPKASPTHAQAASTFDSEGPKASGSNLQVRVDAADTQDPSASTSTMAPRSKRKRSAKMARQVESTGTGTTTLMPGKGKRKLKDKGKGKQTARAEETERNIEGNEDRTTGEAGEAEEQEPRRANMSAEHVHSTTKQADTTTEQPKANNPKGPNKHVEMLNKMLVSMKSANAKASAGATAAVSDGSRARPGGEPSNSGPNRQRDRQTQKQSREFSMSEVTPVSGATLPTGASIPTLLSAPESMPGEPQPTLNPSSTSTARSGYTLSRSTQPFNSSTTPAGVFPQPQLHPPPHPRPRANPISSATQSVQAGPSQSARQYARGQPSFNTPLPPYNPKYDTSIRGESEAELESETVKLSLSARTGFHDGGRGSGRATDRGRGGGRGSYIQGGWQGGWQGGRPGGRQGEISPSGRTRVLDDTSYSARQVIQMREDVRRRVQSAVQRTFGSEYQVEFFGSTRYGVSFSDSDLDMVIIDPHYPQGYTEKKPEAPIYNSKKLANCIRKARFAAVETRPRSTVPIVKFEDPITSLECDLNVNSTLGIINSDMLKAYISLYPPLKSLIFEIKDWAKPLGLNSPAGTQEVPVSWSSYSLACMAVAWCMHQGLLPNLQAGLPPLGTSSPPTSRSPSPTATRNAQIQADAVTPNAGTGPESELHLHLADSELMAEASAVGPSQISDTTRSSATIWAQDQLVWTLKPHRGWDARYRPANAESVQAEMRVIEQTMGPERKSVNKLFAEWLLFWANFDFKHQAVCIRLPGGIIDRESPEVWEATHRERQPPAAICVVDPFIRSKNCTVAIAPKTLDRFKAECAREAMVQAAKAAEGVRGSGSRTGNRKSSALEWQRDGPGRGSGRIKY